MTSRFCAHAGPDPGRGRPVGLVLSGALALAVGLWLALGGSGSQDVVELDHPSVQDSGEPSMAGAAACAECHAALLSQFQATDHARSLQPAGRHPIASLLADIALPDGNAPGKRWSYEPADAELQARSQGSPLWQVQSLDWAVGAGRWAVALLGVSSETDGHWLEHAVRWESSEGKRRGAGPSTDAIRRPASWAVHALSAEEVAAGLDCHGLSLGPDRRESISCESCHGPGRSHIVEARRGSGRLAMPFGAGRSLPGEELRLCGRCHRDPSRSSDTAVHRLASRLPQPLDLTRSACFLQSDGRLSCTTCHDPHQRSSQDRASYERVCLGCHEPGPRRPEATACPVAPRSGCVECHLPMVQGPEGQVATDHRIRVHPGRVAPRR